MDYSGSRYSSDQDEEIESSVYRLPQLSPNSSYLNHSNSIHNLDFSNRFQENQEKLQQQVASLPPLISSSSHSNQSQQLQFETVNPFSSSTQHEYFNLTNHPRVDSTQRDVNQLQHENEQGQEEDRDFNLPSSSSGSSTLKVDGNSASNGEKTIKIKTAPEISPRRTRSKRLSEAGKVASNPNDYTPTSSRSSSSSRSRFRKTTGGGGGGIGGDLDSPPTSGDAMTSGFGDTTHPERVSERERNGSGGSSTSIGISSLRMRGTSGNERDTWGVVGDGGGGSNLQVNASSSTTSTPSGTGSYNYQTSPRFLENSTSSSSTPSSTNTGHIQNYQPQYGSSSAPPNILTFSSSSQTHPNLNSNSIYPLDFSSKNQEDASTSKERPFKSTSTINPSSISSDHPFLSSLDSEIQKKISSKFVYKVYKMCCDPNCSAMINWSENGETIQIVNLNEVSKEILGRHFKHNNFSSFIRQLNM